MKRVKYSFSDSDVSAILFALSVLPSLCLESTEVQSEINFQCCRSAGQKLISKRTDITPNEFRVILGSLHAVQLINRGEIEADLETKKQCSNYMFSVNKLVSALDEQSS